METYPTWPNLAARMFARARTWPKHPMLRAFRGGVWQSIAWDQFARMTASLARGLREAGISAGDRVVICAENRPEYPIAEVALMAIRAVPVSELRDPGRHLGETGPVVKQSREQGLDIRTGEVAVPHQDRPAR